MSYFLNFKTNQSITFEQRIFSLKYGTMSKVIYTVIESNLPNDNFNKLPLVLVKVKFGNKNIDCYGLVDTGANTSFISARVTRIINPVIIDSLLTSTIIGVEEKPVVEIELTTEALDNEWKMFKVGVTDFQHPNIDLLLGRDFLEHFKLEYNQKDKTLSLEY